MLVVIHCPDDLEQVGYAVRLRTSLVIGRDPGRHGLELADGAVSRKHARITWHARFGLAQLEDLNSKNGTLVNGLITSRRYLEDSDVLRIGDTLIIVRQEEASAADASIPDLVGDSPPIRELRCLIEAAAPGALPVLLQGETGTGKELAAQALHQLSGRAGAFVPVNCSAIAKDLFESTFFGHRKGAFTGADSDQQGLLAAAHGGTLFLDEIAEMPAAMQPKLLRFIEDGQVRPLGGTKARTLDVRVIAATNRDTARLEKQGLFRADLRARLAEIVLELPPLDRRRGDIRMLLEHFARQLGRTGISIETDALEALLVAPWGANVRELRSLVRSQNQMVWNRRHGLKPTVNILLADLPEPFQQIIAHRKRAPVPPLLEASSRPSREELEQAVVQHDGNLQRVADFFGKDRKQIYRWMDALGVVCGRGVIPDIVGGE